MIMDAISPSTIAADLVAPRVQPELPFAWLHPRRYSAYSVADATAITIDGKLDEPAWEDVPFSEPFVDIMGPQHWSQPWFSTRVKMRYNASHLFIGAYLEDSAVWAHETQRNAVVYHDNDFEVFVDAAGHTHNYVEIEVNALNTTWNLQLDRPYRDGGHENSTRVDPRHGFDLVGKGFQSAVFTEGPPNDAAQSLHYWTVEMALPMRHLVDNASAPLPPKAGSFWRINFSRVQWATRVRADGTYEKIPSRKEDNWVWSPQYAVNMHMPEQWGYVFFSGQRPKKLFPLRPPPRDPNWPLPFLAFQVYHAQHAYRASHGRFTAEWRRVEALLPVPEAAGHMSTTLTVPASGDRFDAGVCTLIASGAHACATVRSDGWYGHVRRREGESLAVE
ncbi:hypothetical protein ATCC90586_007821 [Pythium insidiosum]|nr:hypothetical protein ATCC90586_007821 [Pythium insidiosum]